MATAPAVATAAVATVPPRPLGPKFTVVGDDASEPWDSWPWQAMLNSGGRLALVQQLLGDWDAPKVTSAYALANLSARLGPITPSFAVVAIGMNDPVAKNGPIPFSGFQANYTAICARLEAAGSRRYAPLRRRSGASAARSSILSSPGRRNG